MSSDNVELVRRNYEVINSIGRTPDEFVDPEEVAPDLWARLAPDFELHERPDLPDAKTYRGRDESKAFWRKTQELFAEIHWEPLDIVDLGHAVVVEARVVGLGRGSDVPFEGDETDVFWFRDGLIVRLQAFPTRAEALAAAGDQPVQIVPYDPAWPARFEEERVALAELLGDVVTGGIHHIGSTAVPGLAAKPIIDIQVGVADLESARSCIEPLAALDYVYAPYRADEIAWFCKPSPERRTHHLHLVPVDSPRFTAVLEFRDLLRSDPDVAREYEAVKRRLAAEFEHDREAYTEAKQPFVRSALARARA